MADVAPAADFKSATMTGTAEADALLELVFEEIGNGLL